MVLATAHLSDPLLADAARAGLPVVLMNRMAQDHSLDSVSVDNERGMRMAVAHLAAEGHRKIAHIAGPQEVSTGLSRYRGFVSETFQGMYAPTGTPDAIVQRVVRDTLDVLADAATLEKLRGVGFDVRASGPAGLAQRVAREVPMWRDVIVQSRIELQ